MVPFLADVFDQAYPVASRLVEPFCGSCAVAIGIEFPRYWLNDINSDLGNLYDTLIEEDGDFIKRMGEWWEGEAQTEEHFYEIRDQFNSQEPWEPWKKAALFYWLKCHAHSGVIRYGPKGYNVPYGKGKKPAYPAEKLEVFWQHFVRITTTTSWSFGAVLRDCGEGDLVYCDPPYTPLKPTGYVKYWRVPAFAEDEHRALVEAAHDATSRGAVVVISNHDIELTRNLYHEADSVVHVMASRSVRPTASREVPELIAIYGRKIHMQPENSTTTSIKALTPLEEINKKLSVERQRLLLEAVTKKVNSFSIKDLEEFLS